MITRSKIKIGIIGFGRFGQLLAQLLVNDFQVFVYDPNLKPGKNDTPSSVCLLNHLSEVNQCDVIFIAVPIRQFEATLKSIAQFLSPHSTVIDVCSVKMYPVKLMLDYLPKTIGIIATHPLFGPDSINNPASRKIMMHPVRVPPETYSLWKTFFQDKHNMNIIEMTPEQHDELAAKSQSITHFIGRILEDAQLESTGIDTKGFQKLLKLKQQTCNDSWELFFDIQRYNPYSKLYINKLMDSAENIYQKILDNE